MAGKATEIETGAAKMPVSDFLLGLIILGVVCLIAVLIYNKLQERRVRRALERSFRSERQDVLFTKDPDAARKVRRSGQRTEPTLNQGQDKASGLPVGASSDEARESLGSVEDFPDTQPGFTAADIAAEELVASVSLHNAEGRVVDVPDAAGNTGDTGEGRSAGTPVVYDEEIHVGVVLTPEQPVSGDRVLACLQDLRHTGRRAVTIIGALGESGWVNLRAGGRYDTVLVAVLLANRSGPLNEIGFSEFVTAVQHAADQIPATCDVPDMKETVERARELDARCAALDTQVCINLAHPQGRWSGDLIASVAEEHGMVLRNDGRFHAQTPDGGVLFSLQNGDGAAFRADQLPGLATERVTLLLDVPHASRAVGDGEGDPFAQMIKVAQVMGKQLGAVLVDDNMRSLTPAALDKIAEQLEPVYARLEAAGMSAGSARARALFG